MPRVTVRATMGFTESFENQLRDLRSKLSIPALEERLRRALAESFLVNIRSRYNSAETEMNLQRRISNKKLTGQLGARDRATLARINTSTRNKLKKIAQEFGPGDIAKVRDALKQRDVLLAAYRTAKYRAVKQKDKRGRLVQNALRQAAQQRLTKMKQVRDLLTDRSKIKVEYGSRNGVVNSITLRIGNIAELDKIKTPSATPLITGHRSTSKFNILWRQMEFGTGVFAFPTMRTSGRYKTSAGTWWFGPRKGFGVHFAGNKPGQFLRQRTGELYSADAMQFESRLKEIFSK